MKNFKEIIEEVKNIISSEIMKKEGKGRKIKDSDVATALQVSPQLLATHKHRGQIMYEQIADFCARKSISINTLLYGQSAESLVSNTDKYLLFKYCLTH